MNCNHDEIISIAAGIVQHFKDNISNTLESFASNLKTMQEDKFRTDEVMKIVVEKLRHFKDELLLLKSSSSNLHFSIITSIGNYFLWFIPKDGPLEPVGRKICCSADVVDVFTKILLPAVNFTSASCSSSSSSLAVYGVTRSICRICHDDENSALFGNSAGFFTNLLPVFDHATTPSSLQWTVSVLYCVCSGNTRITKNLLLEAPTICDRILMALDNVPQVPNEASSSNNNVDTMKKENNNIVLNNSELIEDRSECIRWICLTIAMLADQNERLRSRLLTDDAMKIYTSSLLLKYQDCHSVSSVAATVTAFAVLCKSGSAASLKNALTHFRSFEFASALFGIVKKVTERNQETTINNFVRRQQRAISANDYETTEKELFDRLDAAIHYITIRSRERQVIEMFASLDHRVSPAFSRLLQTRNASELQSVLKKIDTEIFFCSPVESYKRTKVIGEKISQFIFTRHLQNDNDKNNNGVEEMTTQEYCHYFSKWLIEEAEPFHAWFARHCHAMPTHALEQEMWDFIFFTLLPNTTGRGTALVVSLIKHWVSVGWDVQSDDDNEESENANSPPQLSIRFNHKECITSSSVISVLLDKIISELTITCSSEPLDADADVNERNPRISSTPPTLVAVYDTIRVANDVLRLLYRMSVFVENKKEGEQEEADEENARRVDRVFKSQEVKTKFERILEFCDGSMMLNKDSETLTATLEQVKLKTTVTMKRLKLC